MNINLRHYFFTVQSAKQAMIKNKNGVIVNIPSYQVSVNDEIRVTEKARSQLRIKNAMKIATQLGICEWLQVDEKKFSGTVKSCLLYTSDAADE